MNILSKLVFTTLIILSTFKGFSQMNTNNTHQSKGKKILFVVTSHSDLGNTGEKTGIWIEEFAAPYYFLHDKGVDITIASPAGGAAPIDPKSTDPNAQTEATKRYYSDPATQERLAHTVALSTVKSEDYDAVFYPGGHGPMWDLAEDKTSAALIGAFLHSNKPAALVCHAPVALQHVVDGNGAPFVKGKNVTGFSNSEEAGVKLTTVVPFLLEDMLKSKGAHYQSGPDWQSFSLQDGLLITGQNPASSIAVAEKLLQQVTSK